MKLQPELLTHPIIPEPLHGLAPREILGKEWWDVQRKAAYAASNNCCWACGIHKSEARFHQWLEAHESYRINYQEGTMEMVEIVALCHSCHNFIHSGRLGLLWKSREATTQKVLYILQRGFKILQTAGLEPFYGTAMLYAVVLQTQGHPLAVKAKLRAEELQRDFQIRTGKHAPWSQWRLLLEGMEYPGKFKNEREWAKHYATR
jgi:hypothetical protein